MSQFITDQRVLLGIEVAKAARITLYGLHYEVYWTVLENKNLILKALEINDTYDLFTSDEQQCLEDKLSLNSFCNC